MGSWWARVVRPAESADDLSVARQELKEAILDAFSKQTLLQHLQDIDGWKAFHDFMESEYCGENTKFWLDVEELHIAPDDKVEAAVNRIFDHYFGDNPQEQVNLPISLVRSITANVQKNTPHKGIYDAAQKRILCLMEGSQWHRYPSSPFFNMWVEAKLTNPDSLFVIETPKIQRKDDSVADPQVTPRGSAKSKESPTNTKPKILESEIQEKLRSHLKSKPLLYFIADPLGFRCFETYLDTSKIGFEYSEFLSFWLEVEAYKDHPSTSTATALCAKYLSDTNAESIGLPDLLISDLKEAVETGAPIKELLSTAQAHLLNKLKKEAYTRKFFVSDPFFEYLTTLTSMEFVLLTDLAENDGKQLRNQFDTGRPSDKGLDFAAFQAVIAQALESNYNAKFKNRSRLTKWCKTFFKKFGVTNTGYISFTEFAECCKELIREPRIPYHHLETINQ